MEKDKPIALEAWETLAERYAALADAKANNTYLKHPATPLLSPDVRGKRIVDAGCEPGYYSEWLVSHGAEIVAFDVSPKMVKLVQGSLDTWVDVRQADLAKPLDFLTDKYFNIVLCPLILDYIQDLDSAFSEFYRVLRESGLLIFSVEHPFMKFNVHSEGNYFATELVNWESQVSASMSRCHTTGDP
jgi:SAM-dependent methyltransferase